MDKREELKRKLERIEREETAKQERPPEQSEASAPSTEAVSASPPPAPLLTAEQMREIARGEIEEALRTERTARREESARTEAKLDGLSRELTDSVDELSRGLTDTNERLTETDERVSTLREDTHDSLIPMAQQIAELRSRQNSRALPPPPEPRNVTPRLPSMNLSSPSTYRPLPRTTEPEEVWPPKRKIYPRSEGESSPPRSAPTHETEEPPPLFFVLFQGALVITLLIAAVWIIVLLLLWAWAHLLLVVALAAVALILLIWLGAMLACWSMEMRMFAVIIFLVGATIIFMGGLGYSIYRDLTKPKPSIELLGD